MEECIYCKPAVKDSFNPALPENKWRSWTILGVTGITLVTLNAVALSFVLPALRKICLPFVPATQVQIKHVIQALNKRKGTVLDLGSGDGRIVFAAARCGFQSTGIELNPWLVLFSRFQAYRLKLNHLTKFHCLDLWKVDFSPYNNIIIFGVEEMMPQLEKKFSKELTNEACVIACRFPLPTWMPSKVLGHGLDTVWLYRLP